MQADAKEQIERLLKEHGFVLERDTNHLVYKQVASGKTFTMSKTPSDFRAYPNALRDLKRILGFKREVKIGERREKKRKPPESIMKFDFASVEQRVAKGSLADQLAAVRGSLTLTGRKQSEPEMQMIDPPTGFEMWLRTIMTAEKLKHHEQDGFTFREVRRLVKLYEERA